MVRKAAKIQDVALAAGVSTATVSRALSNPDLLSKATREAVQEAIRTTGYRANRAARNLRKQSAGAVLVLVPSLGNPFFSQILAGITSGFAESEYSVLIAETAVGAQRDRQLADYFGGGRVDGMISLDGSLEESSLAVIADAGVADRVVFACEWVAGSSYPSVRSDNEKGAHLAVQHLYDLGHREIAHVTGPKGNVLTRARRQGMLAERARLGLTVRDEWIIRGDFSLESGHAAAQQIVAMKDRPTAVFCASDMVAIGLISGLTAAGLSVPGDISVVGFDDIEMSAYYIPALTTIRQDRRSLGLRSAQMLLDQLAQASEAPQDRPADLIDVQLIARDSTAPL